jgi:hypothetical protein
MLFKDQLTAITLGIHNITLPRKGITIVLSSRSETTSHMSRISIKNTGMVLNIQLHSSELQLWDLHYASYNVPTFKEVWVQIPYILKA